MSTIMSIIKKNISSIKNLVIFIYSIIIYVVITLLIVNLISMELSNLVTYNSMDSEAIALTSEMENETFYYNLTSKAFVLKDNVVITTDIYMENSLGYSNDDIFSYSHNYNFIDQLEEGHCKITANTATKHNLSIGDSISLSYGSEYIIQYIIRPISGFDALYGNDGIVILSYNEEESKMVSNNFIGFVYLSDFTFSAYEYITKSSIVLKSCFSLLIIVFIVSFLLINIHVIEQTLFSKDNYDNVISYKSGITKRKVRILYGLNLFFRYAFVGFILIIYSGLTNINIYHYISIIFPLIVIIFVSLFIVIYSISKFKGGWKNV